MSDVDRRNFLRAMIGGLATTAAVRTFPFRVFSFPDELALPDKKLIALVSATDELLAASAVDFGSVYGWRTAAVLAFWENEAVRQGSLFP